MGLPGETYEDLEGIAGIARKIMELNFRLMGRSGGRFQVNVSVSNFVPKAHTPFQWEPQDHDFYAKHDFLREKLKKIKGVRFHYHDSPVSTLEAVFARGDRRLGALLLAAYRNGCRFDSWSESFDWDKWKKAIEATGTDIEFYTTRRRDPEEILPWDLIDSGITKTFLLRERDRAMHAVTTPDCREGCQGCGINQRTRCRLEGIHA